MNISRELSGSCCIKNCLHKAQNTEHNTQKRATSGLSSSHWKRLGRKICRRLSLIPKHLKKKSFLSTYLFTILSLNSGEEKNLKFCFLVSWKWCKTWHKLELQNTKHNKGINEPKESMRVTDDSRVQSKAIQNQSIAIGGKVSKREKIYVLLQTRCSTWRHEQSQDEGKLILEWEAENAYVIYRKSYI